MNVTEIIKKWFHKSHNDDDNLADLEEEIKGWDKDFARIILQPPRRMGTGELLPITELDDELGAFIEKKKAELNVDDWPPKYRGWVPSDALVEEYLQFSEEWRAQKYGEEN